MEYIIAMLDFLKHGPRSNIGVTSADVENCPSTDCRPWSRPDHNFRLRVSDNKAVRIFGYPNREDIAPGTRIALQGFGNSGPPILYLRGDVPAYVSYIMGNDWRTRLRGDHYTNSAYIFHNGQVILQPSAANSPSQEPQEDLEALERYHCLRMRRCGAVGARSEVDIMFEETGMDRWLEHLFGWPTKGGVWILRSYSTEDLEENSGCTPMMEEMNSRLLSASEAIKQQTDINELCSILKEAGGQFYSNIEDCLEVNKLGLHD